MDTLFEALGFNSHTMNVRTGSIAGTTIFPAMGYILAVNPAILFYVIIKICTLKFRDLSITFVYSGSFV